MFSWQSLLQLPTDCVSDQAFVSWFQTIADVLLRSSRLVINGASHRLTEVEFYYHSATHPDPFSHRHSLGKQIGRWYLHRSGEGLRNGNYKGLDVTFGNESAFGGILFRSLETPENTLIDGPSLLVDYIMKQTRIDSVRDLNSRLLPHLAWNDQGPIYLQWNERNDALRIWQSSRIGMSLKRNDHPEARLSYFFKRYRFLTEPRRIRKGRLSLCLNLLKDGLRPEEIKVLTGCPLRSLHQYQANIETGKGRREPMRFLGRELNPREICELYGTWAISSGAEQSAQ